MSREWSPVFGVHRALKAYPNPQLGEDVKRLQAALNNRAKPRGLPRVKVDGAYGPATAASVKAVGYALGAAQSTLDKNEATKGLQRIIRYPGTRNPAQLVRARKRRRQPPVKARGIDVSNHQGKVDWKRVRAAGYTFAWAKATEATGFHDAWFLTNVREARKNGVKVGAYHFLHHGDISAQASNFIGRLRAAGMSSGDLLPVVDVEANGATPQDANAFCNIVENTVGVRPIIYTFPAYTHWPSTFGCKLWIAHFGAAKPTIPRPWTEYAAWQYSSSGRVPGVNGNCDLNTTPNLKELMWP